MVRALVLLMLTMAGGCTDGAAPPLLTDAGAVADSGSRDDGATATARAVVNAGGIGVDHP
ncbi:MAG TPA: hypothetical protein VIA18_33045 [Polyangia bacterium]|jgi:hypothetical protein|nr:hypothetical protein [Polyangia bacterium]HWE28797.1 hypothetical protein [Polyangia bacterium]